MTDTAVTLAIGFVSGVLSGMFGIGGGVVTTPALRLILGAPALIAVGTPLPVIIPSAITGAISYTRRGLADVRTGVTVGLVGSGFAVAGALLATRAGGRVVLMATAVLIVYMAADMLLQTIRPPATAKAAPVAPAAAPVGPAASDPTDGSIVAEAAPPERGANIWGLALLGAVTGLYSGFLGLGGGFVLVPMLTRWFGFPVKRAIGTSLVAVGLLAIPGTISHYLLGNVDVHAALLLIVGVVPGALVGARITFGASDRAIRLGFAALLLVVGVTLAASELGWLG